MPEINVGLCIAHNASFVFSGSCKKPLQWKYNCKLGHGVVLGEKENLKTQIFFAS